jgi:hypothetical protein
MWGIITHWRNMIRGYQNVASSRCVRFASPPHNLEPTATGKYVLKLMNVGTFKSIGSVSFLHEGLGWRVGKRGGGGGEDPYIGVVMWRMKNIGTFVTVPSFKAVSYDRLLRKKCYISTARCAKRRVCAVYHHTSDDAMSLTFSNNLFHFSLTGIVNYTVLHNYCSKKMH